MNFQQLETFQWVAYFGSFTKAADKVNATQSTVSMRISDLEQELGVQLFDRTQRRVHVTAKGRELLRYAEQMSQLTMEIRANIGNPEKVTGEIRLGVAELIALTWLPDLVAGLSRVYPNVEVDLEVGLRGDSHDRIRARETDLCFLPIDGHAGAGLEDEVLTEVEFAFMASPSHGLHGRKLAPQEIEGCPMIMLGPNSVVADIQNRWFRDNGIRPAKFNRSNSMEISAGLVRSGLGISFLPRDYYSRDISEGRMVILDMAPQLPPVKFSVIYAAGMTSPLIRKIIDIARTVCLRIEL